jgi:hypothetical protein
MENAEDFLDRVNDISAQVADIISGKVDVDELDRQEKEQIKFEERTKEIKAREEKERLLKGTPSKGHKEGYKAFCNFCFREWSIDGIDKCTQCGKNTITFEVSSKVFKTNDSDLTRQ